MNNVRLVNFRNIKDSGEIELKPLTIFVGKNGSGKSSLLRLFPLLQQSLSVAKNGPLLWYHEKGVDFGDFKTTVRNGENEIKIGFTLRYDRDDDIQDFPVKILISIVPDEKDKDYDRIGNIALNFLGNEVLIDYKEKSKAVITVNKSEPKEVKCSDFQYSLFPYFSFEEEYKILGFQELRDILSNDGKYTQYTEASDFIGLSFDDFKDLLTNKDFSYNLTSTYNSIVLAYLNGFIVSLSMMLNFQIQHMTYIGPFRTAPNRYSRLQNLATKQINKDGSNMAVFVNAMKDKDKFNKLLREKYKFELKSESHFGQISLSIIKDGKDVNIIDTGFGYSQLMPVLLALFTFDMSNIPASYPFGRGEEVLCIEQPELHLHPSMQFTLGQSFVDSVKNIAATKSHKKIILETHSRSIIDAVGFSLSTGVIKAFDVAVYLFDTIDGFAKITHSSYNEDGYLTNWPLGFLD